METEVLIIGGGLAGTSVARELSQYELDITVVEKRADVCSGHSKAGGGFIYTPLGLEWLISTSLKAIVHKTPEDSESEGSAVKKESLAREGYELWKTLLPQLDINYVKDIPLVVATNDEEMELLRATEERAKAHGMDNVKRLDKEALLFLEPELTDKVIAGLVDEDKNLMTTYTWEVILALAENAQQNGVKFLFDTEVTGFSQENGFQIVETTKGLIKTEFIINACGADGAKVAKMADACDFSLQYFKGISIIMDKKVGSVLKTQLKTPPKPGFIKQIQKLQSGNLLLGFMWNPTINPEDTATDKANLEEVFGRAQSIVPCLSKKDIVTYYSYSRVFSGRDPDEYICEYAPRNPKFINVILRMPGIAPCLPIAKEVASMIDNHGLSLTRKDDFNPYHKGIPRFRDLNDDERSNLIAKDPEYGHVVCRCETVTEGEIVEAIRRGARTLDGIKLRTRAGMGRCQSGFCAPHIVDILANELNIHPTEVTKKGGNSRIFLSETKAKL